MSFNDDERIVAIQDDSGEKTTALIAGKISTIFTNRPTAPLEESKLKVLLELTGAGSSNDRYGLDLVAVLDISDNMKGEKLAKMKIAMQFIINKLSPIDRLSVVIFAEGSKRLCPLRQITDEFKKYIEKRINNLACDSGTNIVAGLKMGLKVLNNRIHTRARIDGIMLMSDGEQTTGDATKISVRNVPVYTFGFGRKPNASVLRDIAGNSQGGSFSNVPNNNDLSIVFSQCLSELLGVVVQDLTLTVEGLDSTIKQVVAGNYLQIKRYGTVTVSFGDLYLKEVRKVLVKLLLPAVRKECGSEVININYSYSTQGKPFKSSPLSASVRRTWDSESMEPEIEDLMIEINRLMKEARVMGDNRKQQIHKKQGRSFASSSEPYHDHQHVAARDEDDEDYEDYEDEEGDEDDEDNEGDEYDEDDESDEDDEGDEDDDIDEYEEYDDYDEDDEDDEDGEYDEQERGSIGFSATYRPPVPLDIFSCLLALGSRQPKRVDEVHMTEGLSYNYNGHDIPWASLKTILKHPKVVVGNDVVDSGMVFVSERANLETLHIALLNKDNPFIPKVVQVLSFSDVFDTLFNNSVRMEDSGSFAGDYLVYVSTHEPSTDRRQPWTAVFKTNLTTGETDRLTPKGTADLSPSVQPSGNKIAVASFERKGGWDGEIEDLKTDIYVMNVKEPFDRRLVVRNGGWPTWGSDGVIFFHRKVGDNWGVFRADISKSLTSRPSRPTSDRTHTRVTPVDIDAMTPAAINATTVAVATIRMKSEFSMKRARVKAQYRHIEIFDSTAGQQQEPLQLTQRITPMTDHFNPFVIDGGKRIGYHRSKSEHELKSSRDDIQRRQSHKLSSPHPDVGLFRVPGIFPTFSKDGSKLAFVDNEFKNVWVADKKGMRIVLEAPTTSNVFSPVWNQDPEKDVLYVNMGASFNADQRVNIYAIPNASSGERIRKQLTTDFNNAFPSTNPEGTKFVYRSTRDGGDKRYKNLYIMEDIESGEFEGSNITRLTKGEWTDTHCHWSPRGDWIVFSSTRDKPKGAPESDNGLDPGYFAVFLVKVDDPSVLVRVITSASDVAGHVNHPFFSPDGESIVVTADLAGVSVDPISLPLFLHSVRPYGDIFVIDIHTDDIRKNVNLKNFIRITHSRYENATAAWTEFSTEDPYAPWNKLLLNMTDNLGIQKRCC